MAIPNTMRCIHLVGHGGPEMLEWKNDVPVPTPGPNSVLIQVAAAGVNNTDINTRMAWYSKGDADSADASWSGDPLQFPRIQGIDVCGHIVAVGHGVSEERIGERVLVEPCFREFSGQPLDAPWYLGSECDGGFAEYMVSPAPHAYRIDSDLSDVELASFPCSYSTAENMLTRAAVKSGDQVLITGASGGVGSAAVQLARAHGAEVIALSSSSKAAALEKLGADRVVSRDQPLLEALGKECIDVVIDLVAGPQWPDLLEVLRPGGRYAVSGAIAGPLVELDVRTLYLKDLRLLGCTMLDAGVFANLVERIEQGQINPLVAATFTLEDIAKAQAMFAEKGHIGKIVLNIRA